MAPIWAFGCVLYEMLTGLGAFTGATISDNLASVIRAEPEWSFLPTLRERMTWIAVVALLTLASTRFGVGYFSRTPKPGQPIISQIGPPETRSLS